MKEKEDNLKNFRIITASWPEGKRCKWRGAHRDAKIMTVACSLEIYMYVYTYTYTHTLLQVIDHLVKSLMASKYEVILFHWSKNYKLEQL